MRQQIKEQQKKQLRKSKQLFRKLTMAAYQSANPNDISIGNNAVWDDLEKMNDDVSKQASHMKWYILHSTSFYEFNHEETFYCSLTAIFLRRLNCCQTSCH